MKRVEFVPAPETPCGASATVALHSTTVSINGLTMYPLSPLYLYLFTSLDGRLLLGASSVLSGT